ncbi:MAG: signal peptidase I [Gemmatimonadota bacterium]
MAVLLNVLTPGLGYLYAGYPRLAAIACCLGYTSILVLIAAWLLIPSAPLNIVLGLIIGAGTFCSLLTHSAILASHQPKAFEPRWYNRWSVYLGYYLLLGLLLGNVLSTEVRRHFEAFRVPSGSMTPTLMIGDFIFAYKPKDSTRLAWDGAVVIFTSIEEPGLKVVKRVMGVPGDTLAMVAGVLSRNGKPMVESYVLLGDPKHSEEAKYRLKMREWQIPHLIGVDTSTYQPDIEDWGPLVVSADSVLVFGDDRDHSYDSRYYGFIPVTSLIGAPRVIYFSVENDTVGAVTRGLRWSRIGRRVE